MKEQSYEHVSLVLHPKMGATIADLSVAALQLAASEWRNVSFTHNEQEYKVCVNDLIAQVGRAKS